MYLKEQNLYINDEKKILFDLLSMDIYELDNQFYIDFKKLYEGESLSLFPKIEQFMSNRNRIKSSFNKLESNIENIKLNVSHGCNLRCSYCYAGKGDYGDNGVFMKISIAQRVSELIDNYAQNVKSITFFGGEPTLNPDVIEYFCEKYPHFTFMMQTNGTNLLNPRIVDLILKYNFKITVSIDGPKEIHDSNRQDVRGNPTYDLIKENVKRIMDTDPNKIVSVQATYTTNSRKRYSKKEVAQSIFNDFGVPNIAVNNVWEKGDSLPDYKFDLAVVEEQFSDFLKSQPFYVRTSVADILSMFFSKDVDWHHYCEAGLALVSIDPNGDIWPCHLFVKTSEKIANVKEDELASVWNKISNYPEIFHTFNKDNSTCNSCIARFRCRMCKRIDQNPYQEERCSSKRLETIRVLDLIAEHHDRIDEIVSKLDKVQNVV